MDAAFTRSSCDRDKVTSSVIQDGSPVAISEVSAYHGQTDLNNENKFLSYCNCGSCGVRVSGCNIQTGIKNDQSYLDLPTKKADNENSCVSAMESLDLDGPGLTETYRNAEDVLINFSEDGKNAKEDLNTRHSPRGSLLKRSVSCVAKIMTSASNSSYDGESTEIFDTKSISSDYFSSTRNTTSRGVSTRCRCSSTGVKKTKSQSSDDVILYKNSISGRASARCSCFFTDAKKTTSDSSDDVADIFKNSTDEGVLSSRCLSSSAGAKEKISDSSNDEVALYKNGSNGNGELYQDGGYEEEDFEDDDEVFQRSFRSRRVLSCLSLDLATTHDKVRWLRVSRYSSLPSLYS